MKKDASPCLVEKALGSSSAHVIIWLLSFVFQVIATKAEAKKIRVVEVPLVWVMDKQSPFIVYLSLLVDMSPFGFRETIKFSRFARCKFTHQEELLTLWKVIKFFPVTVSWRFQTKIFVLRWLTTIWSAFDHVCFTANHFPIIKNANNGVSYRLYSCYGSLKQISIKDWGFRIYHYRA